MRQYLTATIQAMSQSELDEIVHPLTKAQIKRDDPNPEIRVYSIGHEGESNLHLPGIGNKTFTWIQAAVRMIAEKVRLGTAVFDRHNPTTNSHEGREQIGQVVGTMVKKIGDRLNTLAAIHIFPQFKSRPLDIASFEAEIEFDHDGVQAWPKNIGNVSGIALSNSGIDSPGFPGATLLGAVQAYAVQAFEGERKDKNMNLSDVKAAAKELGLKPSQIFEINDIMADSAVDAQVKTVTKEHFAMAKRVGEERDELRTKNVQLENQYAETEKKLKQREVQSKSTTVFDALLADPACTLDATAKLFVKRNAKNFSTEATDEDALKADVSKFINTSAQEYGELAKDVFGVKTTPNTDFKIPASFIVDNKAKPGEAQILKPPETYPNRDTVIRDEMNPKTNPLIAGGEAAKAVEAQTQ